MFFLNIILLKRRAWDTCAWGYFGGSQPRARAKSL